MLSSFVAVSQGEVIKITEPTLKYCPLVDIMNKDMNKKNLSIKKLKHNIQKSITGKIKKFGYYTADRELERKKIAIPYGASEMISYACKKGIIDAAVVACDGTGTIVVDKPELIQGIGARMNGLFYTTPITEVINNLEARGCRVIFPGTAKINQIPGIKKAAELGYKNIAVTINGYLGDSLQSLHKIEKNNNISITSLMVCNTAAKPERIREINDNADLVWSCASRGIREQTAKESILQITTGIPVFVLTKKGLDFVAGYAKKPEIIRSLNPENSTFCPDIIRGKRYQ